MKGKVVLFTLAFTGVGVANAAGGIGIDEIETMSESDRWVNNYVEVDTTKSSQGPRDVIEQYEAMEDLK